HGLGAQCKLAGNKVEVEAYFDDGTPAADARVYAEDRQKKRVAAGRTDAKGRWSFTRPAAGNYVVIVDAGAGHRTQVAVTIPEAESADDDCCCCEPPSRSPSITVSEGPDRDAFTGGLWLKIGVGLSVIGGL